MINILEKFIEDTSREAEVFWKRCLEAQSSLSSLRRESDMNQDDAAEIIVGVAGGFKWSLHSHKKKVDDLLNQMRNDRLFLVDTYKDQSRASNIYDEEMLKPQIYSPMFDNCNPSADRVTGRGVKRRIQNTSLDVPCSMPESSAERSRYNDTSRPVSRGNRTLPAVGSGFHVDIRDTTPGNFCDRTGEYQESTAEFNDDDENASAEDALRQTATDTTAGDASTANTSQKRYCLMPPFPPTQGRNNRSECNEDVQLDTAEVNLTMTGEANEQMTEAADANVPVEEKTAVEHRQVEHEVGSYRIRPPGQRVFNAQQPNMVAYAYEKFYTVHFVGGGPVVTSDVILKARQSMPSYPLTRVPLDSANLENLCTEYIRAFTYAVYGWNKVSDGKAAVSLLQEATRGIPAQFWGHRFKNCPLTPTLSQMARMQPSPYCEALQQLITDAYLLTHPDQDLVKRVISTYFKRKQNTDHTGRKRHGV